MDTDKNIKVLYIDDEQINLRAFVANFRNRYEITTAISAEQGLEILAENFIHIIVCDQRMPNMTGVQFFEKVQVEFPDPMRLLLTGYADIEAVINSINKGRVFSYIDKPWDDSQLAEAIDNAYKAYLTKKSQAEELDFFIYKASHDLRGPLASIKGLVDLAKADLGNRQQLDFYLTMVDNSIKELVETVNELLDYKKLEASPIQIISVDLNDLVASLLSSLQYVENYSRIDFKINITHSEAFYTDYITIRSLLQNLVHNAINYGKYVEGNKPLIEINFEQNAEGNTLIVRDNGIGMRPEVLNQIFDMFYRDNVATAGSGLGLYIVKKGIKKLRGSIEVASEYGKGTCFTLNLPKMNLGNN